MRPCLVRMTLDAIRSDFALLDDWEDRYRYVIELGRGLPPLPEALRTDANKVRGCASQVWLAQHGAPRRTGAAPRAAFPGRQRCPHRARADRHPVCHVSRTGRAEEILGTDAQRDVRRAGAARSTSPRSAPTASSRWWSASAAMPAQLRLPRRHLMGKNHHATWGRHAMTPSVRARTSGEARHVATAS